MLARDWESKFRLNLSQVVVTGSLVFYKGENVKKIASWDRIVALSKIVYLYIARIFGIYCTYI